MKKKQFLGLGCLILFIFLISASSFPILAHEGYTIYDDEWVEEERDDVEKDEVEWERIKPVKMTITIDRAYYCDADFDGEEDDIVVHFTLDFHLEDWDIIYFYKLDVGLELPSGLTFKHRYYLKTEPSEQSVLYMFNHATESGWYTVGIHCTAYIAYKSAIHSYDSLIFDPPGGRGGTEPVRTLLMI